MQDPAKAVSIQQHRRGVGYFDISVVNLGHTYHRVIFHHFVKCAISRACPLGTEFQVPNRT